MDPIAAFSVLSLPIAGLAAAWLYRQAVQEEQQDEQRALRNSDRGNRIKLTKWMKEDHNEYTRTTQL